MKVKRKGFSLVEVIAALTLFAISVLVLTQSFLNGLLCKTNLTKENHQPFIYTCVRNVLETEKRDKIASDHALFFPDNKTQLSWKGSVTFSNVLNLFQVEVHIKDLDDTSVFWVRRPDWMSNTEKMSVLQTLERGKNE